MGGFFFTLNDSAFFEEQLFDTTPSAENYVKLYFWVTMGWKPYFLLSLNNSCKTNITANNTHYHLPQFRARVSKVSQFQYTWIMTHS